MTGSVRSGADPDAWGVATGYHDHAGRWVEPPAESVAAVLEAMGATKSAGPPPPTLVTVRTDHQLPPLAAGTICTEDGGEIRVGRGPLPADLPTGYHRFQPDDGPGHPLVVSPGTAPLPAGRQWGFAAQLYATRSRRSWGIGDLGDLTALNEWAAGMGAGFTLVNPLHAARPEQPSPYYPGSRCFLNPIYIAVERVAGASQATGVAEAAAAGRALNDDRLIDRARVWAVKEPALRAIFAATDGGGGELDRFLAARGDALRRFAVYGAVAEHHGGDWRRWPEGAEEDVDPSEVRFHAWLQWTAEEQAARADATLGLVTDLAVGVDPGGPDTWLWPDAFATGITVGAPPDEFNTRGQDWGLPPFDPWRLRGAGYEPYIETLRSGLRHGAGLRVDHVMGLFRLFWIPEGEGAGAGTYVRYPHDDLLNILALEADRAGAYVVGEDLGTVEDAVRRDLAERQVLSYRLWWFEPGRPQDWPEKAMGAVTTHDLPTVAGVLTGSDLQAQRDIGTEPNEESSDALRTRVRAVLESESVEAVIEAVYADLAAAPCLLLTATLDDVAGVEERPNMPGTTDAWPNWSLALPAPLEDLEKAPLAARVAHHLRRGGGG